MLVFSGFEDRYVLSQDKASSERHTVHGGQTKTQSKRGRQGEKPGCHGLFSGE